ncbi:MAG: TonB-dependent receptor [Proteobacteria bacterium]|nr:TonB-dependent receptor [Pseudomonadota bacterium]
MMKRVAISLGCALAVAAVPASYSAEEQDSERKAIEEIIVTAERGETSSLDRAMTVTGFNNNLIQRLGIQNTNDMEVLVPGMQIGPRSQGGGKNEDGHIVMRGVANDRSVNFFQDVSVAVYIDGVYSDQSYGLDQGAMFDVERVEVARGPQGTTGGKAAIAGSVSFVTKKPTYDFDVKASAEFTDQASQQANVAFGGPIGDTGFAYRLGLSRLVGDGVIENIGPGPDAGEPDQLIYSPQLRFKNDRWDITARYSKLEDKGTPRVSLVIGARNVEQQFLLDTNGQPLLTIDPATIGSDDPQPIRDANGNPILQINPFFGLSQNPAVANCPGFNNDGTRTPGTPVVCDGEDLQLKVDLNAPILQNNTQESVTLEAHYMLNDSHEIIYKFGNRDTRQQSRNDIDGTSRQGGGVCSPIHPRVLSGELQAGQTHPRCALDGKGNGAYADQMNDYLFTSDQDSHEFSLVSSNDGPFNYTLGYTNIKGDEPYVYSELFNGVETGNNNLNVPGFYVDTSEICEAELVARNGTNLWREARDPSKPANKAAGFLQGCHGASYAANWSDVTNGFAHVAGGPAFQFFYGNVTYESKAIYGNAEYVLNDQWKVFGGLRYNDDHKEHDQNDFTGSSFYINANGVRVNSAFAILRSKQYDYTCCGYVGINKDASGNPIPDSRTFVDSKRRTWKETTWNVGAEYSPNSDMMWYGRISHGYRPGGFAGFGNLLGEGFDEESMINYEGGLKGLFFDNTVQLEVSAYYQDFDAFWVQAQRRRTPAEIRPGQSLYTGETNVVDGTEISGIELQGAWQINDRLTVRGFYEFMHSSFGAYETTYCCTPAGTTNSPSTTEVTDDEGNVVTVINTGAVNFGGNSLRNQPKHKLSATVSYDVPIRGDWGSLEGVTVFSWRDSMYVDESNLDLYSVPEYARWDVRANWTSPSGTYSASAWVTNLLDQVAVQGYAPREGNGVTGPVAGTVTDERRFGLTINYQL